MHLATINRNLLSQMTLFIVVIIPIIIMNFLALLSLKYTTSHLKQAPE